MNSFKGAWYVNSNYTNSDLQLSNKDFLRVNACGIDIMHSLDTDTIRSRPLGRKDYQIIYIKQGCCYYVDENGNEASAGANSVIIFKPNEPQIYKYRTCDKTTSYWIHFTGYGAEEILNKFHLDFKCFNLIDEPSKYISATTSIINILRAKRPMYLEICATELMRILAYLGGQIASLQSRNTESNNAIDSILTEIANNYSLNLPIAHYAKLCGLDESYFIKLFKLKTGVTPKSYIINLRTDYAAKLLIDTNMSISNISSAVGYDDYYYFIRIFKKRFGISPGKFRKQALI